MKHLPLALACIGIVPFVVISMLVPAKVFSNNSVTIAFLLTYASVIISFLGGIHWGVAVTYYARHSKTSNLLILGGVLPPIIAWGALFYYDTPVTLLILTLLYTSVWAIDSLLYSNDIIPQWFFNLRCIVTPVVVVSLYVAYFGLI